RVEIASRSLGSTDRRTEGAPRPRVTGDFSLPDVRAADRLQGRAAKVCGACQTSDLGHEVSLVVLWLPDEGLSLAAGQHRARHAERFAERAEGDFFGSLEHWWWQQKCNGRHRLENQSRAAFRP